MGSEPFTHLLKSLLAGFKTPILPSSPEIYASLPTIAHGAVLEAKNVAFPALRFGD
jgi:hypothetical protein